jgi:hypothetical protein
MVTTFVEAAFAAFLVPAFLLAKDLTAPVLIDPTIQSYDGLFSRKLSVKYFVDEVADNRPNAPTDTLGTTRTGRNTSAPLVTRLGPSTLLRNSIQGMFRDMSVLTDERIDATYAVQAEVLLFEITETNKGLLQEIKAALGYRVKIRRLADNEVVRQFIITSEDTRKALDTTKFAETVASNALMNGLIRLMQDLSSLK